MYNLKGVVSWCPLFRGSFCIVKCRWERGFCPLSGIEKRPLLGACLSITSMVISLLGGSVIGGPTVYTSAKFNIAYNV